MLVLELLIFFLFGAPHAAIRKQGELKPKGKERDI